MLTEQSRGFHYLGEIGPIVLGRWGSMPAGDHDLDVPWVSEMPGWPQQNTMLARRLTNGGVMIRPRFVPGVPFNPNLFIQPSATSPSGVEYKLNGKILTAQSPVEDLFLAMELTETLWVNS